MGENQAQGNLEGYRKWKQIGHILRQDNESMAKKALKWNPQGGRRKGRPRIT
jgi:hypothetical protein